MAGKKGGFYAVRVGRRPGVYTSWPEAEAQVKGYVGASHKKFPTMKEAEEFTRGAMTGSKPLVSDPPSKRKLAYDSTESSAKRTKPAATTTAGAHNRSLYVKGRVVYCDGSSRGNGQAGAVAGIGVFWGHEVGAQNLSERLPGTGKTQTNNRAEMYAVARILESDPHPDQPLTICSDSEYTIKVFSQWVRGWMQKGWKNSEGKPVANRDLIEYVVSLIALRMPPQATDADKAKKPTANVTFLKVKAHVGIEGNEMADKFANTGAMSPEVPDRDFEADTAKNKQRAKERGVSHQDIEYDVLLDDLLTVEELNELSDSQQF